jgi:hypothetical protein
MPYHTREALSAILTWLSGPLLVRPTLSGLALGSIDQGHNILDRPQFVREASGHRGGQPVGLVLLHKVVSNEVECQRMAVVVELLRECICEAREAPHLHSHREVVTLGIGR